jgi:formamidopyrimidine-DNA glycosylase
MRSVLQNKKIIGAEVVPDEIVLSGHAPEEVQAALLGRTVTEIGRKGKYWWLEFADMPRVYGHLGMAGWIREVPPQGTSVKEFRLREHGEAPLYDETGRPRFLKLMLTAEDGRRIAFTDSRRFARLWLGNETDPRVGKLGRDAYDDLPTAKELAAIFAKRKAPIKAVLLDQAVFAGIGNWIADEVLFQARIAPARLGNTLKPKEVAALRDALTQVVGHAVAVEADYERFPEDWMFHVRWGGDKGAEIISGHPIVRETIGGRTTAWVPKLQR